MICLSFIQFTVEVPDLITSRPALARLALSFIGTKNTPSGPNRIAVDLNSVTYIYVCVVSRCVKDSHAVGLVIIARIPYQTNSGWISS